VRIKLHFSVTFFGPKLCTLATSRLYRLLNSSGGPLSQLLLCCLDLVPTRRITVAKLAPPRIPSPPQTLWPRPPVRAGVRARRPFAILSFPKSRKVSRTKAFRRTGPLRRSSASRAATVPCFRRVMSPFSRPPAWRRFPSTPGLPFQGCKRAFPNREPPVEKGLRLPNSCLSLPSVVSGACFASPADGLASSD